MHRSSAQVSGAGFDNVRRALDGFAEASQHANGDRRDGA